ncbi:MAG: amidohydrolase family protein [Polaromonas sp.]|uniref:amidohydrolase family protein n=1 Tax=Polaromonas sp. TaxID=1869339 RepID=UPI0027329ACA|nr:amidohydrolase family protein [Polaromonas sp.]MDP3797968.1 amidohydrolase family protein [Polaromonas sp.]
MKEFLSATALVLLATVSRAEPVPLIDTHAHFQTIPYKELEASHKAALTNMDRMNIARSLLMPPPFATLTPQWFYDIEDLQFAVRANPGRFALLGGSSLNIMIHSTAPSAVTDEVRAKFRKRALEIVAAGAVGFGEISALHVSIPAMGPKHAYEDAPPDHPLLLLLADIAAENGIPIDLHCDLVPENMPLPEALLPNQLNPRQLQANLPALKRLLSHNHKARIVWSHVGLEPVPTRQPELVRQMLQAHPNLFMSFRLNHGLPRPAATLTPDGRLKPVWVDLIREFPDRFMLGSDAFYGRNGIVRGSSEEGMRNLRGLIEQLPQELQGKVASENAIRVYRLAPLAN